MSREQERPAEREASPDTRQLVPAEVHFRDELAFLAAGDDAPRPPGWQLSPGAVVRFICGSQGDKLRLPKGAKVPRQVPRTLVISEKFVGERALVERAVVTLAGERGLLLVGEPGTAKSMLSELLGAAISGTSALTVQGTAGTDEGHLRYSWNYGMLLATGPSEEALVPSPVVTAMRAGKLVRVEEITRCLPEVQDALISLISERRLAVPELEGEAGTIFARPGFNVICTANLRDRGVSEMSAALKRRFNFEVVPPIADHARELELVHARAVSALEAMGVSAPLDAAVLDAIVTTFRDLREGRSVEGWSVEKPSTVMSTAEAVAVAGDVARQAAFFPSERDALSYVPGQCLGVILKDDAQDRGRLLAYWDSVVKRRADAGSRVWKRLYELRSVLDGDGEASQR